MSQIETADVNQWSDLAVRWRELAREWAQFWQGAAVPMTIGTPISEIGARESAATPMFDARAVAELAERFAPRVQALWTRVVGGSTTPPADVGTPSKNDRRF